MSKTNIERGEISQVFEEKATQCEDILRIMEWGEIQALIPVWKHKAWKGRAESFNDYCQEKIGIASLTAVRLMKLVQRDSSIEKVRRRRAQIIRPILDEIEEEEWSDWIAKALPVGEGGLRDPDLKTEVRTALKSGKVAENHEHDYTRVEIIYKECGQCGERVKVEDEHGGH